MAEASSVMLRDSSHIEVCEMLFEVQVPALLPKPSLPCAKTSILAAGTADFDVLAISAPSCALSTPNVQKATTKSIQHAKRHQQRRHGREPHPI